MSYEDTLRQEYINELISKNERLKEFYSIEDNKEETKQEQEQAQ